jgi:hypothetical protein
MEIARQSLGAVGSQAEAGNQEPTPGEVGCQFWFRRGRRNLLRQAALTYFLALPLSKPASQLPLTVLVVD